MGCKNSKVIEEKGANNQAPSNGHTSRHNSRQPGHPRKFTETINTHTMPHARIRTNVDINDFYQFDKQVLGSGFSGDVRVAVNKITNKKVAVKTLSTVNLNPKRASMLHNEVSIYLALDHPNIARLFEVFEDDNAVHLVMELCTGKELYERLQHRKKYSESDAARIIKQMLNAINYCHQGKICHRDLKLENWVFANESDDSPLKLIDFGFSRIFMTGVPMTAMHGTVYYVSPEVLEGCYTEQCDIWSIGVIVYMILSGAPPFMGATDAEILHKIKLGHYAFTGPKWTDISQDAKDFISSLLSQDPQKRPTAADAMKHAWLQKASTPTPDSTEGSPFSNELNNRRSGDIDVNVLKSMAQFAAATHIKRAALCMMAYKMTTTEVMELESVFHQLDTSGKGTISLHDLTQVLMSNLGISEAEASRVFSRLDQTGDHQISYTEFLAATLATKVQVDDSMVKETFQALSDANGRVTVESLKHVLGNDHDGVTMDEIVAKADKDKKGHLTFEEFRDVVISDDHPHGATLRRGYSMESLNMFRSGSVTQTPRLNPSIPPESPVVQSQVEGSYDRFRKRLSSGASSILGVSGQILTEEEAKRRDRLIDMAMDAKVI